MSTSHSPIDHAVGTARAILNCDDDGLSPDGRERLQELVDA